MVEIVKVTGAVLFDDLEDSIVLVYSERDKKWGLPGGHIELGETALQALDREVHIEETKIEMVAPMLIGYYHSVSGRGHRIHNTAFYGWMGKGRYRSFIEFSPNMEVGGLALVDVASILSKDRNYFRTLDLKQIVTDAVEIRAGRLYPPLFRTL